MTTRFSLDLMYQTPDQLSPDPLAQRGTAPQTVDESANAVGFDPALSPPVDEADDQTAVGELFVPDNYEPNYAYPLLVWLTPQEATIGKRFSSLMRQVSERNYFGLAISLAESEAGERQLFEAVAYVRRRYHLHTERVFVVGQGAQGTRALQIGLSRPDWFAGFAALSARWPDESRLLRQFAALRGTRVFLGAATGDHDDDTAAALGIQRLLWSAGMQVTACTYPAEAELQAGVLRALDRWVMQRIEQPELILDS